MKTNCKKLESAISVINDIVGQTNLLALNAVRMNQAVNDIRRATELLKGGASEAIAIMEEDSLTSQRKQLINSAESDIAVIDKAMQHIAKLNRQLADAAKNQLIAIREIRNDISQVNSLAQETPEDFKQLAKLNEVLHLLAAKLSIMSEIWNKEPKRSERTG